MPRTKLLRGAQRMLGIQDGVGIPASYFALLITCITHDPQGHLIKMPTNIAYYEICCSLHIFTYNLGHNL